MAEQYWIGGFFIDLSRNQITQGSQSQTLPPKALAVLTCLAENKGKVVSQEALLAKVWPETIVSPNTLQRSIAQLRKALGDDGKVQSYIKTHAKQGYSLECDIRWNDGVSQSSVEPAQHATENSDLSNTENSSVSSGVLLANEEETGRALSATNTVGLALLFGAITAVAGLVVIGLIYYQNLAPESPSPLSFGNLRQLTATDEKEFDATYSPDGQYIVFHRALDKFCNNTIWAKNVNTGEESLLTKRPGAYGRHSFSPDGKTLVFLATEACNQPDLQKNCYDLVRLDFEKGLTDPQPPTTILQCKNSDLNKPTWLDNDNIVVALRKSNSKLWKLIKYSIRTNTNVDLFRPSEGNLIDFSYSLKDDIIAVISIHDDGRYYIEMIEPNGHLLSSHKIKYPKAISEFKPIHPNFSPLNNQLIFSTGRQLYALSYEGEITKISLPFADKITQPEFHPSGKKLLMTKGPYDSDIVRVSVSQAIEPPYSYTSFERSNRGDSGAKFHPSGENILYWSERSGDAQLWLSDSKSSRQLTHFPVDSYIGGFEWAEDGQSILANIDNALTVIQLDSQSTKKFPLEHVVRLYHWDSNTHTALAMISTKGILTLVEYNLITLKAKVLTDNLALWAQKTEDGQLIYKDITGQFWQPGPIENQRIKALENQGSGSKAFLVKGSVIYGLNSDNELWSYNLDKENFKLLGQVGESVESLSDIHQSELLMTIGVSTKREVVELSIEEK